MTAKGEKWTSGSLTPIQFHCNLRQAKFSEVWLSLGGGDRTGKFKETTC